MPWTDKNNKHCAKALGKRVDIIIDDQTDVEYCSEYSGSKIIGIIIK